MSGMDGIQSCRARTQLDTQSKKDKNKHKERQGTCQQSKGNTNDDRSSNSLSDIREGCVCSIINCLLPAMALHYKPLEL